MPDPNPKVKAWKPSPATPLNTGPFEQRHVGVFVNGEGPKAPRWEYWTKSGDGPGEVDLGSEAGTPKMALSPGDYWVSLTESEKRRFGAVELVRLSRSMEPFHVMAKSGATGIQAP